MSLSTDQLAYFAQTTRRSAIDLLFEQSWVRLYRCDGDEAWFSGLLAADQVGKALGDITWDLHWHNMRPSIATYGYGPDARIEYERFQDEGIEPIVIVRERGKGPFFVELAEDIRLYLNLYPGEDGALIRDGASGEPEVVAKVDAHEVHIRKGPLLQYLSARQMYLAIYFDHVVTLKGEASNPLPEAEHYVDVREHDRNWSFGSHDDMGEPLSRLCGKRLLAPPPRSHAYDRDEEDDRWASFIIREDDLGCPVEHSADPKALANLFGANPNAPDYLTRVHFRRDVLDRYFHNPGRYEVSDGVVRCDPHWVLRMDDDHRERVVVFLGDLGRDLPYTEQLHWRAHNILPDGGLSVTARTRSFEAQFADGEQPKHRFKFAYRRFCDRWLDVHGWPLFRPLATGDEHLLTKLHVPTSDNPAELDAQLLGLAKILVDSLNDGALDAQLGEVEAGERSLGKLQRFLDARGYLYTARDLATLRAIQSLRSTGAAHGRGSGYTKALKRLGFYGKPAQTIVAALIEEAILMLDGLTDAANDLAAFPTA